MLIAFSSHLRLYVALGVGVVHSSVELDSLNSPVFRLLMSSSMDRSSPLGADSRWDCVELYLLGSTANWVTKCIWFTEEWRRGFFSADSMSFQQLGTGQRSSSRQFWWTAWPQPKRTTFSFFPFSSFRIKLFPHALQFVLPLSRRPMDRLILNCFKRCSYSSIVIVSTIPYCSFSYSYACRRTSKHGFISLSV